MIENTWNYWFIYLKEYEDEKFEDFMYGELYAYTDSKKLKDRFMKDRDPDKFRVVKREIDSRQVEALKVSFSGGYLVEYIMYSREIGEYSMVITENERSFVHTKDVVLMYTPVEKFDVGIPLEVFKEDYLEMLYALYIGFQGVGRDGLLGDSKIFKSDTLGMFIDYFGELLKEN